MQTHNILLHGIQELLHLKVTINWHWLSHLLQFARTPIQKTIYIPTNTEISNELITYKKSPIIYGNGLGVILYQIDTVWIRIVYTIKIHKFTFMRAHSPNTHNCTKLQCNLT